MANTSRTPHPTALAAVNRALVVLGQDVTLSADDFKVESAVAHGRKAAFLYEMSRLAVLRDHAWTFAERIAPGPVAPSLRGCRAAAPRAGETPVAFPFLSPRPGGCVVVRGCLGPDGRLARWRLGRDRIESDVPVARIVYTADIEDLDKWTPDAYRALVLRLAADLAKPVTGRINERQLQEAAYRQAIEDAKLRDAREQNVPYDAYEGNHYADMMRR